MLSSTSPAKLHCHHVFLTGASGYIGKYVTMMLLQRGYTVTASLRDKVKQEPELRQTLARHLHDAFVWENHLFCVELDLSSDESIWRHALDKANNDNEVPVNVLIHLASPTPVKEPTHEDDIIRPAVSGSMKAIKAAHAAGVHRVILTSSVAAVVNVPNHKEGTLYKSDDWTDTSATGLSAYVKSKTLAEKAVWEWQSSNAPDIQLTTILPSFVLGPPLDSQSYGPSVLKIHKIMFGSKKSDQMQGMLPNYGYSCVDVRDVARLHVRAMERGDLSTGKRFIASARCFLWIPEIGQMLHRAYPHLGIPHKMAPNSLVRKRAEYDKSFCYVVQNLDKRREMDNSPSQELLGHDFWDPRESLLEMADFLVRHECK